jgi:hypothetical protein
MTQSEIASFIMKTTANTEEYVDLSSYLTALNRKQYHQFTRSGKPKCYSVSVTHIAGAVPGNAVEWVVAPNNWTVRNACVKMSAAWKHQLKEAGIRMRDLSTYGRRLRIPLDSGMSDATNGSMFDAHEPVGFDVGDASTTELVFATYTTPAGDTVSYDSANEFTRIAIPDEVGAGDSVEMNLALLGETGSIAANAYFGVVDEYLGSRGGVPDEPDSGKQTPDPLNLLQTMFSSVQPSTDEVIEAVEDYQDFRPYADGTLDASASPVTTTQLCKTAHLAGMTCAPWTSASDTFNGPGQTVHFEAPLGVIRMIGSANKDIFHVTVHAIYEM